MQSLFFPLTLPGNMIGGIALLAKTNHAYIAAGITVPGPQH